MEINGKVPTRDRRHWISSLKFLGLRVAVEGKADWSDVSTHDPEPVRSPRVRKTGTYPEEV